MISKTAPKEGYGGQARSASTRRHPAGELSVFRGARIYGGKANGQEIEDQVGLVCERKSGVNNIDQDEDRTQGDYSRQDKSGKHPSLRWREKESTVAA